MYYDMVRGAEHICTNFYIQFLIQIFNENKVKTSTSCSKLV